MAGHRFLLEHKRNYVLGMVLQLPYSGNKRNYGLDGDVLGMDARVTGFSWNTNGIMGLDWSLCLLEELCYGPIRPLT